MFDIIVRLIMGLALIWMGLNLFLGARNSADLDRRLLFCAFNTRLAPKVEADTMSSG